MYLYRLSTLHRVVNPPNKIVKEGEEQPSTRRQSIAFFHNVNRDAIIEVLNSDEPKYGPIVAGEFLMRKHLASTPGANNPSKENKSEL